MDFHDFAKRNGMQITNVKHVFRGPDGRRYERLADGSRVPLSGTARDGEVLMFFDGVPQDGAGATGGGSAATQDATAPTTFTDAYGRVLATGRGPERDRAEGFRIATEAQLADAWKAGDAEPADTSVNTGATIARHGEGEPSEVKKARERYAEDLRNAWRQP
ncbi:hypothetical protein [Xanthobacter autotrophicus]|uniref:hypothetical protein n=1 Tax=Xanthobacter autotrophicus TaxID=280 RepID=UPI0024A6C1A7|nr:hypothetical protein [Xanthobacter autotrophicus]MDI4656569.1 hypothetical protein [Xanthobacter autotrophicus]